MKEIGEIPRKSSSETKVVNSDELFGGGREIVIKHKDCHYRLMITKTGKLILNK